MSFHKQTRFFKAATALFAAFSTAVIASTSYLAEILPDRFFTDNNTEINVTRYISVYKGAEAFQGEAVAVSGNTQTKRVTSETLRLFGAFPIKQVQVEKTERKILAPCGIPFGIKMLTDGVLVTDFGDIDGRRPAADAGVEIGDVIVKINGVTIASNADISDAVQLAPEKTEIELRRGGSYESGKYFAFDSTGSRVYNENQNKSETVLTITAVPVKSSSDGIYKLGVWVRDSTAGLGTMTYYNTETNTFGGLGHGVCDADTGKLLPMHKGEAVSVSIESVIKSENGVPGELCGSFMSRAPIGIIEKNTETGIFGTMNYPPTESILYPVAFKQEARAGEAEILSTLSGNSPKRYSIVIEKVDYNQHTKSKNMVIRVTDPELLSRAGGIVQGMSGSPVIQNGMLVGAVTHVFVGDSTRGYGIFAENMLEND